MLKKIYIKKINYKVLTAIKFNSFEQKSINTLNYSSIRKKFLSYIGDQ